MLIEDNTSCQICDELKVTGFRRLRTFAFSHSNAQLSIICAEKLNWLLNLKPLLLETESETCLH